MGGFGRLGAQPGVRRGRAALRRRAAERPRPRADGLVAPGAEYEALRDEIARELLQVVDADTGEPVIVSVTRREDMAGPDDAHMDELPDLVLQWSGERLLRAVRHPRIEDEVTQNVRDVPYTEHTGEGFLLAAGPSVRAGARTEGRLTDITPTLLTLLGEEVPPELTGTPLTGLPGRGRPAPGPAPPPGSPRSGGFVEEVAEGAAVRSHVSPATLRRARSPSSRRRSAPIATSSRRWAASPSASPGAK